PAIYGVRCAPSAATARQLRQRPTLCGKLFRQNGHGSNWARRLPSLDFGLGNFLDNGNQLKTRVCSSALQTSNSDTRSAVM
ncbi:hypothetical protein J6590_057391, partial [Homalodisca vitripennis]